MSPQMVEKKLIFVCFPILRYGQSQWEDKVDCWGTTALFCDLTNETLDPYELYYGRVMTACAGRHSAWTRTPRFTPWWESEFQRVPGLFLFCLWTNSGWSARSGAVPRHLLSSYLTLSSGLHQELTFIIWQPWKSRTEVQPMLQGPAYMKPFQTVNSNKLRNNYFYDYPKSFLTSHNFSINSSFFLKFEKNFLVLSTNTVCPADIYQTLPWSEEFWDSSISSKRCNVQLDLNFVTYIQNARCSGTQKKG